MAKDSVNNGFIKIDRGILDWQHFTEPVLVQVFIYLLVKANHKDGWWKGYKCERGATMVSIRTICDDLAMSAHTAIKALRSLESTGEIKRIKIDQKTSKTIIVKYSQYQDNSLFSVAVGATQTATQSTTQSATKQEREERKENTTTTNVKEYTHEAVLEWLINSQFLEQFSMSEGITPELCRKLANDIVIEWKMTDKTHRSVSDARQHLLNHIRKAVASMRDKGTLTATIEKTKRLQPLIDDCKTLINEGYKKDDVAEFYAKNTQMSNDGTGRMVFEALNGWDTRYRFIKFLNDKKNYGKAN